MSLTILGGSLVPVVHDGSTQDRVYGADAKGKYLGVVTAAEAAQQTGGPPPRHGEWRWNGTRWRQFRPVERRAIDIEQARNDTIEAGATWSNRQWYADATFQQQIAAYLQAYTEGILAADALVQIRAKDKVVYALGRAELRELAAVVLATVQQAYADSWVAKGLIQA